MPSAQLHILRGARAGQFIGITQDAIVGRAAEAGLRFDPDFDLQVSARHAVIGHAADGWYVRDLGSRNGTFVNGRQVTRSALRSGDRIRFGNEGPELEFTTADAPLAGSGLEPPAEAEATEAGAGAPAHVMRETVRLRWTVGLLSLGLVAAIGWNIWSSERQRTGWERERADLLTRIDSVLSAGDASVRALAGERRDLADALEQSRTEVLRVRQALESAGRTRTGNTAELRRELQSAMSALERQQLAATLDFAAVERAVRRAVAIVWVEADDGTITTGTAFALRTDATLVTARHLLVGENGDQRPRRMAVQFSDSDQVWPARLVRVADDVDLAIIKIDNILGDVPIVPGLNLRPDTLGVGTPVALIGFPLGGETWPVDARARRLARPLGSVGVITAMDRDAIEVQGYGAAGASGSPILDSDGRVLAILFGGRRTAGEQTLVGVPAARVAELTRLR